MIRQIYTLNYPKSYIRNLIKHRSRSNDFRVLISAIGSTKTDDKAFCYVRIAHKRIEHINTALLCEAAILLAYNKDIKKGFLTPAALGYDYIDRVINASTQFDMCIVKDKFK